MFNKFDEAQIKLAIAVATDESDFPGVTEEFLQDFKAWINTDEGWNWILDRRDMWEKQTTEEVEYLSMPFHHTQDDPTGKKDGGRSLVMCPETNWRFDVVIIEGTDIVIPYHGTDEGRISYWNMKLKLPPGDIVAVKGERKYIFPCSRDEIILRGKC